VSRAAASLASIAAAAALALPAGAGALEPRYDHRDQQGALVEVLFGDDTVSRPGGASKSIVGPSLRLAWSFDPAGEGNELVLGVRAAWPRPDPDKEHLRLALDVRYRAYFGTEELKTFLDIGVSAPLASRLAAGPLIGLGLQYDPARSAGLFVGAVLATGFGEARTTTLALTGGAQLRF